MIRVAFIGAGKIGKALAHVIGPRGEIEMWDKDPNQVPGDMKPLEDVLQSASVVFLCVPSWTVREVCGQIAPFTEKGAVIVALSKGLEEGSLKTMDAVMQESLPSGVRVAFLGGPLLSEELLADMHGIGVLAAGDKKAFEAVRPLFEGTNLRLEHARDVRTVALLSVLKNIYAVGLGIAEGLDWGWNGKGWLAGRALEEMTEIVRALGGDAKTVAGSAGAGDFLATAMSPSSRNRTTGQEIGRTGTCKKPSEGSRSLPRVLALLGKNASRFPLLLALDRIVTKQESPHDTFQELFNETD